MRQIHWNNLEVGKIYKIDNYVVFENVERMRLVLSDDKNTYSLWAPDRVRYVIEGQEMTHLRSNGKVDGRWDFDVVQYVAASPMHI